MLKNKKILLGVTGSIAAYKSAMLIRLLVKAGAEVKVVMTPNSKDFITPLTLSTLSKNPVYSEYWNKGSGEWHNHVDLALWADLMVIAPATADTLAKMTSGTCDNLLLAVYLSARCPVMFAPAMDLDMYRHPSTLSNIQKLISYGNKLIEAENGELASGLSGVGRMSEPENIVMEIESFFKEDLPLKGKQVLISAGPTFENIDPVRFIGNRSSGKMGIALTNELSKQGAEVTLVLGPVAENGAISAKNIIKVRDAAEMYKQCIGNFKNKDIVIMSAAISDYTPAEVSDVKIKKKSDDLTLNLKKTKDVLKELGNLKSKDQFLVGFALETNNEYENAVEKLKSKNLDLIVLNSLQDKGAGFQTDTNKVTLIDKNSKSWKFGLKAKTEVAKDIIEKIKELS